MGIRRRGAPERGVDQRHDDPVPDALDAGATGDAAQRPVPDSICPLPWVNLSLDVDGTSRPCCKFAHQSPDSPYQLANLRDAPLDEIWHSPAMQQLRRDFRAGARPAECATCWDEEAAGVESYRQTFVRFRQLTRVVDFDDSAPPPPVALDLKLSNACNLKCRICGPVASSLWLQEESALGRPRPGTFLAYLQENRTFFLSNKITQHPENLEQFRRWLPHLEHLEITGGEPMFSRENRELVELVVREGRPERVGLLFNTNATVLDDRILGHLDRFREVKVCLSIDDVGPRLEYERAPASWADVERNVAAYTDLASDNRQVYAFCSVSVLNAWYLPEWFRWLRGRPDADRLEAVLNLVHYPRHFSVQVLPPPVKEAVSDRLRTELLDGSQLAGGERDSVASVVEFLTGHREDDAEQWRTGRAEILHRDEVRGQDFAATFPEFTAVLRSAGAW